MTYNPYSSGHISEKYESQTRLAMRHSGFGIASFVLSLVAGFSMFVVVVIAGYVETTSPGGMDEESTVAMLVGLSIIGLFMLQLLALVLGFVGVFQSNRQKVFPILGIVFAGLSILGVGFLMVIGLLAEAGA